MMRIARFVLVVLIVVSGCLLTSCKDVPVGQTQSPTTQSSTTVTTENTTPTTSAHPLAAAYFQQKDSGWMTPDHADLLGTNWSFTEETQDYRQTSYYLSFNEWTVNIRWNDGYDEEDHVYRDAPYELTDKDGFAVLEVDFREMAGKLYFNLLISPDRQELYVITDVSAGEPTNDAEEVSRVMARENAPAATEMIGKWDRFRVEVDGYEEDRPSGECTINITSNDEGDMLISYYYPEFPESEYENKALLLRDGALHYNCGNNLWYAEVDYIGRFDTEFSLTLLEDGTLMLQNFYYLDGAPTVSYERFKRIS